MNLNYNPNVQFYIEHLLKEASLKGYKQSKKNLSVLDNDPFWVGIPSEIRNAEWLAESIANSTLAKEPTLYLRRIHYNFVSSPTPVLKPNGEPYFNTQNDWDFLTTTAIIARYLEILKFDDFIDGRRPVLNIIEQGELINPDPIIPELRFPYIYSVSGDIDYYLDTDILPELDLDNLKNISEIIKDISDYPKLEKSNKFYPYLWDGNSLNSKNYKNYSYFYIEIWVEKNTISDILKDIAERYKLNVITGTGEFSITQVNYLITRAKEKACGRPIRVFVLSDFDPAGESIPLALARKIEYFNHRFNYGLDIKLKKLALTFEQVREYNLPKTPIKATEKRKDRFELDFGVGATELDALVAQNSGKQLLESIILQAIQPYRDYDSEVREFYGSVDSFSFRQGKVRELEREISPELEKFKEAYLSINNELEQIESSFNSKVTALLEDYESTLNEIKSRFLPEYNEKLEALKKSYLGIQDLLGVIESECINATTEYQASLEALNSELENTISPLKAELEQIESEIKSEGVELNPLPLDSPKYLVESSDFLYDSSLTPLEQVKAYKRWQRKNLDIAI